MKKVEENKVLVIIYSETFFLAYKCQNLAFR
jgi:hypothetical protein